MGGESTAEVSADPERRSDDAVMAPPAAAAPIETSLTGPLTARRMIALQRAVGNAAVSRLVAARQPATAPPPAAAPPAVAAFGWTDATLGQHVDTGTAEQLAAHLAGMSPEPARRCDRRAAGRAPPLPRAGSPAHADDAARVEMAQRAQRADFALQGEYRTIAQGQVTSGPDAPAGGWPAGSRPADLMAGTHTPTAAERDQLARRDGARPAAHVDRRSLQTSTR